MDTLGAMTFITPAGAVINTAINDSTQSTVDSATRVMVVNGDNKKKKISITDATTNTVQYSFILPRFNTITFIKKANDTVFGLNFTSANAGYTSDATNLTFQKVHTNHAN